MPMKLRSSTRSFTSGGRLHCATRTGGQRISACPQPQPVHEPVFPLLDLPTELRLMILEQLLEPNKPLELSWKPAEPKDGAKTTPDPRLNILLTCKQIREEGMKVLKSNVPFMLNLCHASVSEALAEEMPCETPGVDARTKLWKSLQGFKTVILNLDIPLPLKVSGPGSLGPELGPATENLRAVLRALCGRGIKHKPGKRIIIKLNLTHASRCRGHIRFVSVAEIWKHSLAMVSIECDSDVARPFKKGIFGY